MTVCCVNETRGEVHCWNVGDSLALLAHDDGYVELGRTHQQAVVAGLHPGTVDTCLSEPFQSNLPDGQLIAPNAAAANLLKVLDGLAPRDSGGVFDWKGEEVPA